MTAMQEDTSPVPQPFDPLPKPLAPFVWLASYPRSGNTLLRIILWNCFALRSGSVYRNDLGKNSFLKETAGHIEQQGGKIALPACQKTFFVKTHTKCHDEKPAIYVVRDGRAATLSLWEFYGRRIPLKALIRGNHQFGRWQDHLESWSFCNRADTLFLRYEDLVDNFDRTLPLLAEFLQHEILTDQLPPRESLASHDGRWVRTPTASSEHGLTESDLDLFNEFNAEGLTRAGYA